MAPIKKKEERNIKALFDEQILLDLSECNISWKFLL